MNDKFAVSRARFVNQNGPTTICVGPDETLSIDFSGRVLVDGKDTGAWVEDDDVVLIPRGLAKEVLQALQGTRGDLHFRLAALVRDKTPNT